MHFTTGQSIGTKLKRVLYSRIVLWGKAEHSFTAELSYRAKLNRVLYNRTVLQEYATDTLENGKWMHKGRIHKCRRGGGDDRSTITKMRSGNMKNRTEGDEVTFSLLHIY